MSKSRNETGSMRFLKAVASAFNAAAVLRAGMSPSDRDLRALGIDARAFRNIRRG